MPSNIQFPTDTSAVTPATWDIFMFADISDSNNLKDATLADLPVSTATQIAIDAKVSDTAYAGSWNGVTTIAPSKNAVYDEMELRATKAWTLAQFGATTSAELAWVISDETGTGALVFANSPTLVTPALGTPASGIMTNVTGTASGLTSWITLALKSATTTVDVSAATAPSSGQVLMATSNTTATWQDTSSIIPTAITVADESADTTCFIGFFTAATGNLAPKTNVNMTFNSLSWAVTFGWAVVAASLACPTFTTSSGAMGFTPAAGSNFNVTLSTTWDFVVNTNDLYVDTSAKSVGIGTTSPASLNWRDKVLEVSAATIWVWATPWLVFRCGTNYSTNPAWEIFMSAPGGTESQFNLASGTNVVMSALNSKAVTFPWAVTVTGHVTLEGVTSTGATGTGAIVFATSPTLVTPVLGVATATSINKVAITAPATSATLTIADWKTLTISNSITFAGTDSTTMTFPSTSATIARTDAANTFTGIQSMTSPDFTTSVTTTSTSFTAWAGATTLLTIGGTGASASLFAPSTLDTTSSTTGAIRTSGGISAAKAANFGTTVTVGTTIELGHASDTTLSRVSAGVVAIEGNNIMTVASTDTVTGVKTMSSIIFPTNWQLKLTVPTTDGHATWFTCGDYNSGYTSSAVGDLVYLDSSNTWQKCDANTLALYNGLLGIALEVKASWAALLVALPGSVVYATGFPALTVGSPVYMSETAGAITQTAPTTADSATRVIGWAVHADKIYFFPSPNYTVHV